MFLFLSLFYYQFETKKSCTVHENSIRHLIRVYRSIGTRGSIISFKVKFLGFVMQEVNSEAGRVSLLVVWRSFWTTSFIMHILWSSVYQLVCRDVLNSDALSFHIYKRFTVQPCFVVSSGCISVSLLQCCLDIFIFPTYCDFHNSPF